jgi:G3E family GTPase
MNAMAKIYRTRNSELGMDALLGVKAFDLERALEIAPNLLGEDAHVHDEGVYSVALVQKGALDGQKLNAWMSKLLSTKGTDIIRMKGILNIAGEDDRFVFQGVQMIFDGRPYRPWKANEIRKNELVFISRNLDEAKLKQYFQACIV